MKEGSVIIRPAVRNFIGSIGISVIGLGVISFLMIGLSGHMSLFLPGSGVNIIPLLAAALIIVAAAGMVVPVLENVFTQELEITGDEVIFRRGFIRKSSASIGKNYIFSVEATQNFYQRIVGTGDIVIVSGGYVVIQMYGAADPFAVVEKYLGNSGSFPGPKTAA